MQITCLRAYTGLQLVSDGFFSPQHGDRESAVVTSFSNNRAMTQSLPRRPTSNLLFHICIYRYSTFKTEVIEMLALYVCFCSLRINIMRKVCSS